jgi:DNA-binding CsgD family transcriptional regulator
VGVTLALAAHARRRRAPDPLRTLTARQREVVLMAVGGATNDEIARRLFVTRRTVESHLTGAFRVLGLSRRGQLAALVVRVARADGAAGQAAGRTA